MAIVKVPSLSYRDLMQTILDNQRPSVSIEGRAGVSAFERLIKDGVPFYSESKSIRFQDICIWLDLNVRTDEIYLIITMEKRGV